MASFIGVLTTPDPRYIVLIVIDESRVRYHTKGIISAPVARTL
ncbi:MAG: hypothetical protein ACR5K2_02875 [Wolbachia sp.]